MAKRSRSKRFARQEARRTSRESALAARRSLSAKMKALREQEAKATTPAAKAALAKKRENARRTALEIDRPTGRANKLVADERRLRLATARAARSKSKTGFSSKRTAAGVLKKKRTTKKR